MGKSAKVLKGCLLAVGTLVLAVLAVLGIYIGWGMYANERAEAAATALCAGTRIGDSIESVHARAERADPKPRVASGSEQYHFTFQGAIFHARECQVSTAQGRVTARKVVLFND